MSQNGSENGDVVNQDKTQIVHFRQKSLEQSSVVFNFGSTVLSYTDQYKYLDMMRDERIIFQEAVSVLAQAAGRVLGSVLNTVKHCGIPYLYTTL